MNDYIYYYTKGTLKKTLFGEIQTQFNMSLTMDGTKDSMKVIVYSFQASELEPQTIIKHENTNTWWVVSHDKVERNTNENGFYYIHNLDLIGAIELLNARDLTDCGFNQKTYTIEQFVERLISLSSFEIPITFATTSVSKDTIIDYTKSFENYTPLSALREFFDAYNCVVKMSFLEKQEQETYGDNDYHIYSAVITEYSKTGKSMTPRSDDIFTDIRETKTVDKNSFGTIVISNAENVISTKAKTFPATGTIKLSSNLYKIESDNALIRLPSNIFKVNWLDMIRPVKVVFDYVYTGTHNTRTITFIHYDFDLIKAQFTRVVNSWQMTGGTPIPDNVKEYFLSQADTFATQTMKAMTTRFWYNDNYDPIANNQTPQNGAYMPRTDIDNFYFPKFHVYNGSSLLYNGEVVATNEELGSSVENTISSIMFKRGSNTITNFNFLGDSTSITGKHTYLDNYDATELGEANTQVIYYEYDSGTRSASATFSNTNDTPYLTTRNTAWRVNYIPMSDLKIKYDNSGDSKDTQLYNQNGRLTDSNALSKLLLSYSKEITSNNITKFKTNYVSNFSTDTDLPKVGDLVSISSVEYVINNVSYDFYPNEIASGQTKCYAIVGEYTMSKKIAVKSLMTNPNTNIRDYGIPQNNNVARKQLYRDFYEFDYTTDTNADSDYYMPINKMLNVSNQFQGLVEHVAVMKLTFDNAYGGGGEDYDGEEVAPSDTWYYQLDTTTYVLKKSVYEVVNLNDNNIIGYCSQNVHSAWDIRRVFTGMTDNINTPISYVDTNGKVKGFEIAMCNLDTISSIYIDYLEQQKSLYPTYAGFQANITNYSIFIPSDIYEGFTLNNYQSTSSISDKVLRPELDLQHDESTYYLELENEGMIPDDFSGTNIIVDSITCVDSDDQSVSVTPHILWLSTHGGWTLRFTLSGMLLGDMKVSATITTTYPKAISGAKDNNDFEINETTYNKDAIEVPVFEYSCQIDDTENVIVGENVFNTNSGDKYVYTYLFVDHNSISENNFGSIDLNKKVLFLENDGLTSAVALGVADMEISNSELKIALYGYQQLVIDPYVKAFNSARVSLSSSNKDLVIIRHTIPQGATTYEIDNVEYWTTQDDLMFIIKKPNVISDNKYVLKINHYKIN